MGIAEVSLDQVTTALTCPSGLDTQLTFSNNASATFSITPRSTALRQKTARFVRDMATTNPLFKFGVDLESVDGEGKTALHRAAMFSDQDKVH